MVPYNRTILKSVETFFIIKKDFFLNKNLHKIVRNNRFITQTLIHRHEGLASGRLEHTHGAIAWLARRDGVPTKITSKYPVGSCLSLGKISDTFQIQGGYSFLNPSQRFCYVDWMLQCAVHIENSSNSEN